MSTIPVNADEYSKEDLANRYQNSEVSSIALMSTSTNPIISNEYLEIAVESSTGTFTLGCTGGNPSNPNDDYKRLLYGHPNPWSSISSVKIDDNAYIFGSGAGSFSESAVAYEDYIRAVWECDNIQVTQINKLITNPATGRADTMMIKYQLKNLDQDNSHDVGLRILLDTQLGSNDGAPFQIPGTGDVVTEIEFLKSNGAIPDYWQCFDSLSNPTMISQGTLKGSGATEPDRLIFAAWPYFMETFWDYPVTTGKSITSDSAVGLYWNVVSVAPSETIEYVTYYGLSELSQSFGEISLSVAGPAQLDVIDNQYSPNPFTIVAYVEHEEASAIDIDLTIDLPAGLELVGPSTTQTVSVGAGEVRSVSWTVRALDRTETVMLTYTVASSATAIMDQSVSRVVTVPAIVVDEPDEPVNPDEPVDIPEFPTIALPVIAIIGLAFVLQKRE
ncbi:PEF-CTERM sorting domain-containing protein [Methanolobus sp.]|uniref:PEF-CTERM sorting domain-containing protein n=1 Tax=Methanolobus sp. TaxID=1874737 RepID=UPI0025EADA79|nr:PEF-CTERM sorting domain-containing protein [Methanolobus sp.]